MTLTLAELQRFAVDLVADRERWRHHIRHTRHARVYQQIWDDENVNAWVICWSEGQDTGFHDHDHSAAAIAVITGRVREERLRLGGSPRARVLGPGSTLTVPPTAIHRVRHHGGGPAITIHAYSPPLTRTGVYRVGAGGELDRVAQLYEQELQPELAVSKV